MLRVPWRAQQQGAMGSRTKRIGGAMIKWDNVFSQSRLRQPVIPILALLSKYTIRYLSSQYRLLHRLGVVATILLFSVSASTAELTVGDKPVAVAVNSVLHQAVVVDESNMYVVDLPTRGVVATLPLGIRPTNMALNPAANMAVVTHEKIDDISVIDISGSRIIATIPVGREPGGVDIDPNLNIAAIANEKDDSVTLIDLQQLAVIATIPVGKMPRHVAIDTQRDIAVISNEKDDLLSLIDLNTRMVIRTIAVAEKPGALAVNPDTNRVVVVHEKLNRVSVIDLATGAVITSIATGESPDSVAIDPAGNQAIVANRKSDSLTLIDLATNEVLETLAIGRNPVSVAIDSDTNTVVAANEKGDSISIIDLDTAISGLPRPVGKDPHGVAIHSELHLALVAYQKGDSVSVLELPAGNVIATVPVGDHPYGVAIDPQRDIAVVTLEKEDSVALLDLDSLEVLTTVDVGKDPQALAMDSWSGIAVIANKKSDSLSVIDLDARIVTATIEVGGEPRGVAIQMPERRIWVTLEKDDAVQVIDLDSTAIIATVPVGRKPAGIALSPNRRLVVVANEKDDDLALIDLDTMVVVANVPVGKTPYGVAINDLTGEAFVVNRHDDNVSVVSLDTRRVTDTLAVGHRPEQVAVDGINLVGIVSNEGSDDVTILRLPDIFPPEITVNYPYDGLLTNQPQLAVVGSLSETATLKINNQIVPLSSALAFTHSLTLQEGMNPLVLVATDSAGNSATLSMMVELDMAPPAIPDAGLITIGEVLNGQVTVTGANGSVEVDSLVRVTNQRTGETISVIADENGVFTVTIGGEAGDVYQISASDGAGNMSESQEVVVPNSSITAFISGRVYNAVTGASISGVEVYTQGSQSRVLTAGDGSFVLPVPGRGEWTLFFTHANYITVRRDVYTIAGADATTGEVTLRPWDSNTVTISAASGGTLVDSTGNVEIIFPPGALAHDITVLATFLPGRNSFPVALPENIVYLGGVQMGPEHMTFNAPVTVRIKNNFGLAAGTTVPFAFASHDEDDPNEGFYDPGTATVSQDGQFIEFEVMHFSCAFLGPAPGPGAGSCSLIDGCKAGGDNSENQDPDKEDCIEGNSNVNLCQGRLRLIHELPPFNAFGANDAPALVYDSSNADPRPLISANVDMAGYYDSTAVPDAVRLELKVEGEQTVAYAAPSGQTLALHFMWDGHNGRGQPLPTGSYIYDLEAANLYTRATIGDTTIGVEPFGNAVNINGRVILDNRAGSAFGAGWDLRELERIHRQADGTLLLTRGNGGATVYHPIIGAVAGQAAVQTLASGMGDARSVTPAPAGGWFVSSESTDSLYHIAPNGTKTLHATGVPAPKGIAVAPDGVIYAVSYDENKVYRIPSGGGTPEVWASPDLSMIDHLDDLAVGPDGDLYLLDGGFGSIYRISSTGEVTPFYDGVSIGIGNSLITNGMSMAFDARGNLYVSSNYNFLGQVRCGVSYILRFDQLGNPSYYYVGLNVPRGIAFDGHGNLFVADFDCDGNSYGIKMITPAGEELLVADGIAGNVNAFGLAYDLAWANGQLGLVRPAGDLLVVAAGAGLDDRNYSLFRPRLAEFSEIHQDAQGNLTRIQRDGVEYRFNPDGLLLERRWPQGLSWQYEYDTQGRLTARVNAAGHRWRFIYGATGLNEIIDPAGRSVQVTLDGNNNLIRIEEPGDAVMIYDYDSAHRVVSKTDSRGYTTSYGYGPKGNLLEARQANGEVRRFESGRIMDSVTADTAAASSLDAPLVLPLPDEVDDSYTDASVRRPS